MLPQITAHGNTLAPQDQIFTLFESVTNPQGVRNQILWSALGRWIAAQSAATKLALPLIKLAIFTGDHRNANNLEIIYGIEADYDGESLAPEIAAGMLTACGVEAMIYTTPSHEYGAPRWRVLCRLSQPLHAAARHGLVGRLNGVLGRVLASESFVASQAFFVGGVTGGQPVQYWYTNGRTIDQIAELPEFGPKMVENRGTVDPITQLAKRARSLDELQKTVEAIPNEECDWLHWKKVAGAIWTAGNGSDEAFQVFKDWSNKLPVESPKYTPEQAWAELSRSPMLNVGMGTLVQLAGGRKAIGLDGATDTASQARDYPELLTAAINLSIGQVDEAEIICRETAHLTPVQQDAILRKIKTSTGVNLEALRKTLSFEMQKDAEPDHNEIAKNVIDQIGNDNIIMAGPTIWVWQGSGVWSEQEDRAVKQKIQFKMETDLLGITKTRVDGVADVLKNSIYKPDHNFNVGSSETVNCLNGEVSIVATGAVIQPHNKLNYRTTQIPVVYDAGAQCPKFWTFLHEIFAPDLDRDQKVQSILELMGYTLMSHAKHEKFVMLIGSGANGKSVLLTILEELCGRKNVAAVQPSQFHRTFQRAYLNQKLANIIAELKQGETIADAELKSITSGDPTTVENKWGHPFMMHSFATCWFGTNHMPHTRDFSKALFRRAMIFQFNRVFAPHEQDVQMKDGEYWRNELPGILNIVLAAYARAITVGWTVPQSCEEAKRAWRLEADQIAAFVDDRCSRSPGASIPSEQLYSIYRLWAEINGIQKLVSNKTMRDRLTQLGFGEARTSQARLVTGISVGGCNLISGAIN